MLLMQLLLSLVNPTTFTPTTPAGTSNGLHLGSDKMGFVDGGTYKTYMDNAGRFYLGGTSGAPYMGWY